MDENRKTELELDVIESRGINTISLSLEALKGLLKMLYAFDCHGDAEKRRRLNSMLASTCRCIESLAQELHGFGGRS